jgi:RNA polymerase II subunit A C-terminal domain phosphatase
MAGGKKGDKVLGLGTRLPYPIRIIKLYKNPGDTIEKATPVLEYSFKTRTEWYDRDEQQTVAKEQELYTEWNAPEDAKLISWQLQVGDVITTDAPCMSVEEACTHEIQFQGLCGLCGKDMNEVSWASEHVDAERAPINMTHDETNLTVSKKAAAHAEHELQRRLLNQRKLSLVVDLDQTIIHACIEPTIGEWQRDPSNPNYEAVKEVRSFQLDDGPRGLASGCWYYIKMRPGLAEFLDKIAELYELHVYTMGTRAYAMNIAKLVDPKQKLFANRVISRDENGSLTAKSLQRLFPVSTNMVVIIDDRADVWPRNRPNLIKVSPYDFFKGIGDINSSFLPKREDLVPAAAAPAPQATNGASGAKAAPNGAVNGEAKVSALEELANMANGENSDLLQKQTEEQAKNLEKQITDRPLLHLQEQLDKEDEAAQEHGQNGAAEPLPQAHARHHLLLDDDHELAFLERHLAALHDAFFEEYDARRQEGAQSGQDPEEAEMSAVPDVGSVLDSLKSRVLSGVTMVLSGLVPLGIDVRRSEIGLQLQSFGARVQTRPNRQVTHLVVSNDRPRTQKVRQAAKIPSIKIVSQQWLAECLSRWERVDETPYLVCRTAALCTVQKGLANREDRSRFTPPTD